MPAVSTVPAVPNVPDVPTVTDVPTVPALTVKRTQCFYLINTNFHKVHQLINYFAFEKKRNEKKFPR